MKSTLLKIALILAIFSVFYAEIASQYIPGCFSNTGKYCYECLNRKPLGPKQGCGPVLPKSDPCEAYLYQGSAGKIICAQCKPGYAIKPIGFTSVTCDPAKIKGCVFEIDTPSLNKCFACGQEGDYAFLNDAKTQKVTCRPLPKDIRPVKNCLWGSIVSEFYAFCWRCKTGFAV